MLWKHLKAIERNKTSRYLFILSACIYAFVRPNSFTNNLVTTKVQSKKMETINREERRTVILISNLNYAFLFKKKPRQKMAPFAHSIFEDAQYEISSPRTNKNGLWLAAKVPSHLNDIIYEYDRPDWLFLCMAMVFYFARPTQYPRLLIKTHLLFLFGFFLRRANANDLATTNRTNGAFYVVSWEPSHIDGSNASNRNIGL